MWAKGQGWAVYLCSGQMEETQNRCTKMKRSFQSVFRASCSLKGLQSDLENESFEHEGKIVLDGATSALPGLQRWGNVICLQGINPNSPSM